MTNSNENQNNPKYGYVMKLLMLIGVWIFGLKLILSSLLGYYSYSSGNRLILLNFLFVLSWVFSGFYNTLSYIGFVGLFQLIIYKDKIKNFTHFIYQHINNIVDIINIQQQNEDKELNKELSKNISKEDKQLAEKYKNIINKTIKYYNYYKSSYVSISNRVRNNKIINKYFNFLYVINNYFNKYNIKDYITWFDDALEYIYKKIFFLSIKIPFIGNYIQNIARLFNEFNSLDSINKFGNVSNVSNGSNVDSQEEQNKFVDDELESLMKKFDDLPKNKNSFNPSNFPNFANFANFPNFKNMPMNFSQNINNMKPPTKEDLKKLDDALGALSQMSKLIGNIGNINNTKKNQ